MNNDGAVKAFCDRTHQNITALNLPGHASTANAMIVLSVRLEEYINNRSDVLASYTAATSDHNRYPPKFRNDPTATLTIQTTKEQLVNYLR